MMIFIYFIFMLWLFLRYRRGQSVRRWVLFLYLLSAGFSVLKMFVAPDEYPINFIAILYYMISIYILLYPMIKHGILNFKNYYFNEKYIRYLSYLLIVFGFISLWFTLPKVFTLQTMVANLSDIRQSYYRGEQLFESDLSFIEILANWVLYIQFLSPSLCLYYYIKKKPVFAILLGIVSFSPAISNLLIGEREASVLVLANFVFAYLFFEPALTLKQVKNIRKTLLYASMPVALFIIAMTVSRFGDSDGGVLGGLIGYVGEQPFNFSYFFTSINIEQQCLGGKLNFPYLFPIKEQLTGQINEYISANEYLNVFAGIPGSFLLDFSMYAIIIILLIALIFDRLLNHADIHNPLLFRALPFRHFFTYLIYYQIIFMGLFYFDFTSRYVVVMCGLVILGSLMFERRTNRKHHNKAKGEIIIPNE